MSMGTNFYTKENECKSCGRHEEIHLGKSSAGWQFSFQYNGGEYYKNVEEMKEWLKGKKIKDEYNRSVTVKEFWEMVKNKQTKENQNHAKYCHEHYAPSADEHIIGGYSFSDCEFS